MSPAACPRRASARRAPLADALRAPRALRALRALRAALAPLPLLSACARGAGPAPTVVPAPAGAPIAGDLLPRGAWLVTVTRADGVQFVTRLTFAPTRDATWTAHARPGAAAALVAWPRRTLGRLTGRLPARGALVAVADGRAAQDGDTVRLTGRWTSPVFGGGRVLAAAVVGRGAGARLTGELRWPRLDAPAATLAGVPDTLAGRPLRDYPALARRIDSALVARLYDPALAERPAWRDFRAALARRLPRATDDAEFVAAFAVARPRARSSHLELFRDPVWAARPADSLALLPRDPQRHVVLSFPAPGVAWLRLTRWARVTREVAQAFRQIDSAGARTLVLDVRGNPGGDASSLVPAAFLVRDTAAVGAFLGRPWYARRAGPPTPAELSTLPARSDTVTTAEFVRRLRDAGALLGRVPPRAPRFAGEAWLLADRGSASASEPLVELVKRLRLATVVGERTAGAMLAAPPEPIGDGWLLVVPEADYWTAAGERLEGRGVAPDVAVPGDRALNAVADRLRARDPYAAALLDAAGHADAGRWGDAERGYAAAAALAPDSTAPRLGLARAAQERRAWGEAFAHAEWVLARAPGARDAPAAAYQFGRTAVLAGERLPRAAALLRGYLAVAPAPGTPALGMPGAAAAHWRLGQVLERLGCPGEARAELAMAAALDPRDAYVQASLRAADRALARGRTDASPGVDASATRGGASSGATAGGGRAPQTTSCAARRAPERGEQLRQGEPERRRLLGVSGEALGPGVAPPPSRRAGRGA